MTVEAICAISTCVIAAGAILIYVGRSLHTLQTIDTNQTVLFDRTEKHTEKISRLENELTQVKTRQEDCNNCP